MGRCGEYRIWRPEVAHLAVADSGVQSRKRTPQASFDVTVTKIKLLPANISSSCFDWYAASPLKSFSDYPTSDAHADPCALMADRANLA